MGLLIIDLPTLRPLQNFKSFGFSKVGLVRHGLVRLGFHCAWPCLAMIKKAILMLSSLNAPFIEL